MNESLYGALCLLTALLSLSFLSCFLRLMDEGRAGGELIAGFTAEIDLPRRPREHERKEERREEGRRREEERGHTFMTFDDPMSTVRPIRAGLRNLLGIA